MTTSNPHRHTKKRLIKTVGAHTPCSCGYMQDGGLYFYIKDYQGNVRVVLNQANQPVEVNSYYPYGGLMAATTTEGTQPYKYGTKELDRENGLDLYDFHARQMDPMALRFTTIDPKCEKFYAISPYAYCAGNPIKFIDSKGKETIDLLENNTDNQAAKDYAKTKRYTKKIEVFAHGLKDKGLFMRTKDATGKDIDITEDNFEEQVLSKSEIWKNSKSKSNIVIILHSCYTGAEGGLAQKLSKKMPNVTIIAPINAVKIIKTPTHRKTARYDEKGRYVIYVNGEQTKKR